MPMRIPAILGAKPVPEGQQSRYVQGILSSRPSEAGVAPTAIKIMRDEEKLTSSQLKLLNENFEFCGERLEKVRLDTVRLVELLKTKFRCVPTRD